MLMQVFEHDKVSLKSYEVTALQKMEQPRYLKKLCKSS